MVMMSGSVTATTTAQLLGHGTARQIIVQNQGAVAVLIGSPTNQSLSIPAGGDITIGDLETSEPDQINIASIWVKSASSTAVVGWNALVG